MNILYIFPHPDDESFGPSAVMHQQVQQGHRVHLLTLTKGGASSVRHELGLSIDHYGEVRWKEMQKVKEILGLASLQVLDLEDGGLSTMNPFELEDIIERQIRYLQPEVIVTYPIHGIIGHPDHLALHAAAVRTYIRLKNNGAPYQPKRLAFWTLHPEDYPERNTGYLWTTDPAKIGAIVATTTEDEQAFQEALDAYTTYQGIIDRTGIRQLSGKRCYVLYGETHETPLNDLTDKLPNHA